MASYSAIPLQHLSPSPGHDSEDGFYTHDGVDPGTKTQGNDTTQRVSNGSFNGSSVTKPFGKQATITRAGYGRLIVAWWQEILCFTFAAVAFAAIAVILAKYNGQEQPDWKYSLNLSTLVAILSTLLRASMVVVVEESEFKIKTLCQFICQPVYSSCQPAQMDMVQDVQGTTILR